MPGNKPKKLQDKKNMLNARFLILLFFSLLILFMIVFVVIKGMFVPLNTEMSGLCTADSVCVEVLKIQDNKVYKNIGLNTVNFLFKPTDLQTIWIEVGTISDFVNIANSETNNKNIKFLQNNHTQNQPVKCINISIPFINVSSFCVWQSNYVVTNYAVNLCLNASNIRYNNIASKINCHIYLEKQQDKIIMKVLQ